MTAVKTTLAERLPGLVLKFGRISDDELAVRNLLNEGHRIVGWRAPLDPTKIDFERHGEVVKEIKEILTGYSGRFKAYFESKLEDLKEDAKCALGYGKNYYAAF